MIRNRYIKPRDYHGDRRTSEWLRTLPVEVLRDVRTFKCGSVAYDEAVKLLCTVWVLSEIEPEDAFERSILSAVPALAGAKLLTMPERAA